MKKKYLLYFGLCVLFSAFISCHLDDNKNNQGTYTPPAGPPPTPEKQPSLTWTGPLEFENSRKYRDFLRDYKRCDHCTNYIGRYECENFDSRADIKIQFEKADYYPAKVTLTIQPHSERKLDFIEAYAGACGTIISHTIPIELVGTANPFNDSEGFYVRFTGKTSFGFTGLGYVIVTSDGTNPFEDGVLDVNVYYGGSTNSAFKIGTADLENPEMGHSYNYRRGTR